MRVLLDERPCDVTAETVAQAVAEAAALAERDGRLVVEVAVDGRPLEGDELARLAERTEPADELRLVTADAGGLVDRTLADAAEALAHADDQQREAATLLDADRAAEAMERLGEAVAIWADVERAVSLSAAAAQIDLARIEAGDATAEARITQLRDRLTDLVNALRAGDTVAIADTLHYELPAVVDGWRDLIDALRTATGGGAT